MNKDMGKNANRIVSLRTEEMIESEAAEWLTKLDGAPLSPQERADLRVWLQQDPKHARSLKAMAEVWSEMDLLLNDPPILPERSEPTEGFFGFNAGWRFGYGIAAMLLCLISIGIWFGVPLINQNTDVIATEIGKQKVVELADGSRAYLNTDTMLETDYTGSRRIVRLLKGEALFDVEKDPLRPFVVYAGDRQVMAVGTKFVVRLDSENIVVTVTEGKVKLSKRTSGQDEPAKSVQEEILVSSGQQVSVDNKTAISAPEDMTTSELEEKLSWTNGQLIFKDEPLQKVIEEVSRYVPNQIVIDDPGLRDILISGRFQIGDTEALLEAIEVSFQVKASHIDNKLIRLAREE